LKKVIIGIVTFVVIALIVAFVPIVEVPYAETIQYEDTETYYDTQPLTYEVVESHTETDSYNERRQIVIGGVVFQDEVVEVFYPVGYVTLQNKDNVSGTFGVQFTFYALEKSVAGMYGYPDLDWDMLMTFCDVYEKQDSIILEPGETETITAAISDIDVDRAVWKWGYTITEPTKSVEKERTVTKERTETHYEKITIFKYLLSRL